MKGNTRKQLNAILQPRNLILLISYRESSDCFFFCLKVSECNYEYRTCQTANTETQLKTFEHHREKDLVYNYLIVSVWLRRERRSGLANLKARTRQRINRNTNRVSSFF